jgi:hypothetical protein
LTSFPLQPSIIRTRASGTDWNGMKQWLHTIQAGTLLLAKEVPNVVSGTA